MSLTIDRVHEKLDNMKTASVQQELMLVTTTTFLKQEWCKLESFEGNRQTQAERLEEACWNGLLSNMLPEIMAHTPSGKQLFLWRIRHAASTIKVELGETPSQLEERFSIDATFFLPTLEYN